MIHIPSSAIAEIAYEPDSATLFIRFKTGGLYAYLDVPASVHRAFAAAQSLGRFFQAEIRDRFAHRRIG